MQLKPFSWQIAWDYPLFRLKFFLGLFFLILILVFIPHFFSYIEDRDLGYVLNDWLLAKLPPADVSLYIFITLYGMSIFFLFRMSRNSSICMTALWAYILLCVLRMFTIMTVPLLPPKNMVDLLDPCSIVFYGSNVITKDLFFSGHTATVFLGALCLQNKKEKIVAFTAAGIIAILLLIQHVHYTADVVAAPFFSWLCWYFGKTISDF